MATNFVICLIGVWRSAVRYRCKISNPLIDSCVRGSKRKIYNEIFIWRFCGTVLSISVHLYWISLKGHERLQSKVSNRRLIACFAFVWVQVCGVLIWNVRCWLEIEIKFIFIIGVFEPIDYFLFNFQQFSKEIITKIVLKPIHRLIKYCTTAPTTTTLLLKIKPLSYNLIKANRVHFRPKFVMK